jgi:monovalent cation/hydrogen antiporter
LLTPFAAYLPPAALGGSGVLATVVCGLYISWNGPLLIPSHTRLQGIFFWDLFIFVLEGSLFLLTGLQARPLLERVSQVTGSEFVVAALVTTVAVIAARFLWVFPSLYLPRLLIPAIRRTDPYPIWQRPFLVSFFGVRGIVSLAAALALPFTVASGAPFPHRDLILLLTFWVILVTLVGQGLLVPPLMRWLGLGKVAEAEQEEERAAEVTARRKAIDAAMARLEELASERGLPAPVVENMRSHLMARLKRAEAVEADGEAHAHIRLRDKIERLLIDAERRHIFGQLERGELLDEARRHIERELDLREAELLRNIPGAINFED